MEKTSVTYTCPMHPEVKESAPWQCPECGMNLTPEQSEDES